MLILRNILLAYKMDNPLSNQITCFNRLLRKIRLLIFKPTEKPPGG